MEFKLGESVILALILLFGVAVAVHYTVRHLEAKEDNRLTWCRHAQDSQVIADMLDDPQRKAELLAEAASISVRYQCP